jgi:hypothetical protein
MIDPQPVQFERAEFHSASTNATPCAQCKQPIIQSYYEAGGHLICSQCRDALAAGAGTGRGRQFFRAFGAALAAAVGGAIVWWAVRTFIHIEAGLISIGIGIAVAKAIRWGTFGRGGRGYQILAVILTYFAVALNYTPDMYRQMTTGENAIQPSNILVGIVAGVAAFVIALAVPFLAGIGNIIGIVIIAFGLFQAWKLTARREVTITGPFSVAPAAPAPQPNV